MEWSEEQNYVNRVKIIRLDTVDSTNLELGRIVAAGHAYPWLTVVALEQSGGRGRQGRVWRSDSGAGLWASVFVDVTGCTHPGWISIIAGMSLAQTVREFTKTDVGLKWPNDVMADQRKLAGVLTESVPGTGCFIVGMGLNLDPGAFPGAAGMLEFVPDGAVIDRDELLDRVIGNLQDNVSAWRESDWQPDLIRERYYRECLSIGADLVISELGVEPWSGQGIGIDAEGHLLVRHAGTQIVRTLVAADVVHATLKTCTLKDS